MGLEHSVSYLEHVMGVQLHPTYRSHFVACCPFHQEATPSFHVYADGHMHCYGGACNAHFHDVISLIQAHERISFHEARLRAERLHFQDLSPVLPSIPESRSVTPDQQLFLGVLSEWSSRALTAESGRVALDYLTRTRGLNGPYLGAILTSIGYIPDGALPGEVVKTLHMLFQDRWYALAKEVGILTQSGRSRLQDRLVFWVNDQQGQVVYYQARTIGAAERKYLNPPGLSKRPYIPSKYPRYPGTYICEGPLDAIAVAVHGYFAVALMGSRVPPLSLLKQWPQPLYGLLDQDSNAFHTGQKAQAQLAKLAEEGKLYYRDVLLPPGLKDPAEALATLGPDQFKQSLMLQAA